jgi:hypothetical protein
MAVNKGGRPLKLSKKEVAYIKRLAKIGCRPHEIAEVMDIDETTVRRHPEYKIGLGDAKMSIRRLQWKAAREGSDRMIIHLSKHLLGETDESANEMQGVVDDSGKVEITVNVVGAKPSEVLDI